MSDATLDDLPVSPASEDAEFYVSPSDVDTYELCIRKLGFRRVGNLRLQTRFGERGDKIHGHIEHWLKDKAPPEGDELEAKVARAMIPLLPPPQAIKRDDVELRAGLQLGGIRFAMRIDLFAFVDGCWTVYDHKSTTNLEYALVEDVMGQDVQASLYAAWAMFKTKAEKVRVQWTYGRTNGSPKTKLVSAVLTGADVRDRVTRSVETARHIKLVVESGAQPLDMPYNAAACSKYGGCPYREFCKLTPEEEIESLMTDQNAAHQTYLEELRARKKTNGAGSAINPPEAAPALAAATQPAPVAQAPAVVQQAAPTAPAVNPLVARMNAMKAAPAAAAAPAQEPAVQEPLPAVLDVIPVDEPATRRGRGRPQKDLTADRWLECYAAALPLVVGAYVGQMGPAILAEEDMIDSLAQQAGKLADSSIGQFDTRFGAK